MVPGAAELVVGDDGEGVVGARAFVDGPQRGGDLFVTDVGAAVAGMLVAGAEFLNERHRLEAAGLALNQRVPPRHVLQVASAVLPRLRSLLGPVVEVVERLVMELEVNVRAQRPGGARIGGRVRAALGIARRFAVVVGVTARRGGIPVGPAWLVGQAVGVGPAARVPRPVHVGFIEPVADRRVRQQRDEALLHRPGRVGPLHRKAGVD